MSYKTRDWKNDLKQSQTPKKYRTKKSVLKMLKEVKITLKGYTRAFQVDKSSTLHEGRINYLNRVNRRYNQ